MRPEISPFNDALMTAIRERFYYADEDDTGPRIYLENGGGSLVLKTAVARREALSRIPDASSRANAGAARLRDAIADGKRHLRLFFGARTGQLVYGASGTDLIFRVIRAALENGPRGSVLGSSLEHSSTHDAASNWARAFGLQYIEVGFDKATALVTPQDYAAAIQPDTVLATVIHTSHVSGTRLDLRAICAAIRSRAPDCFIVCDGIQHAPHGPIDAEDDGVDAYVYAPYKAFAPRGGAYAWVSDRLAQVPRNDQHGKAATDWGLGSSDPSLYGAVSAVHEYLVWLGEELGTQGDEAAMLRAATEAVNAHERCLIHRLIHGTPELPGLAAMPIARLIGNTDTESREGAVSFALDGLDSMEVTAELNRRNIRVHYRNDGPSSSARFVLGPLAMPDAVRISLCHYNTLQEMDATLRALHAIVKGRG